jgi:uncharacterized protein (DUF58 family)
MISNPQQLVDPQFFSRLDSIELRAKGIVEGFLQGLHRSPFVGFSVEFASHREYVPGDDLRHVNWKLYARQKRLYVKEFDAETNMNLYVFLDVSRSMECANSGISKLDYGSALAAALSHLALKQHDAVGITLYADEVLAHLAPKAKPHQWDEILRTIQLTSQRPVSDARRALSQASELAQHRGLVVIISDLFDDREAVLQALEHLRFQRHEVVLFHVMDPWERRLPLDGKIRFEDMESGEQVITQTESLRETYQKRMDAWCADLEHECLNMSVDRVELTTDQPLDRALLDYLVHRAQVG